MNIYETYVYEDYLISPINGYKCKRITKQNIKNFGFKSIEELLDNFPSFPLMTYNLRKKRIEGNKSEKSNLYRIKVKEKNIKEKLLIEIEYNKNPNLCPRCDSPIKYKIRNNMYCSRNCANSNGPRSEDCKRKISEKLKGKYFQSEESMIKRTLKMGLIPASFKQNTFCKICNKDTKTKHRKTCSDKCYKILIRKITKLNPKCGGQKHTHRTKIINNKGAVFTAESSYEVKLSQILNELNINWIRPNFVFYTDDNGDKRRYYPDFYLEKYNLYLDPKNDYLIKTDINKINYASKENNITIVIIGNKRLNLEDIKNMVENESNALSSCGCKPHVLLLN